MRAHILFIALAILPVPASAGGLAPAQFNGLSGKWHCAGKFPASGKTIASNLKFVWNAATGTVLEYHDDVPPHQYHAVELWSAGKAGLSARIANSFGGVRDFVSRGWIGNVLTWQDVSVTPGYERFIYTRLGPSLMRIDWQVSKDGKVYRIGDTLRCHKI